MAKTALITGITGQDGSYLAELLLSKNYQVHGLVRRASAFNRSRIDHLRNDPEVNQKKLFLHYGDLHDNTSTRRIIARIQPDEIYHLAGQSHVGLSFEIPEITCADIANGTLALLEIIRDQSKQVRLYLASSSEVFGAPSQSPQNLATPLHPRSPYGCAKAFAKHISTVYRDAYKQFVCNGITYNHESPRRGENFVTRKITRTVAAIKTGRKETLLLGSLDDRRDWGYAPEYVEGMWLALQQPEPKDYIFATGQSSSVGDFVEASFAHVGLDWKDYVQLDPKYRRPSLSTDLVGDPSETEAALGWRAKVKVPRLAQLMVEADLREIGGIKQGRSEY
jgi:GDPmannose 4,6-dehydratase